MQTRIILSLQGTLAKRTKPTLQPNFAKEPFRLSRVNAGLRDSANLIDKLIENIRQRQTQCKFNAGIVSYLGVWGFFVPQ